MKNLTPLDVARDALAASKATLPDYSSDLGPRFYTQHQLMALLVLRNHFGCSFTNMIRILREWTELRTVLGLTRIPTQQALKVASRRAAANRKAARLLANPGRPVRRRSAVKWATALPTPVL